MTHPLKKKKVRFEDIINALLDDKSPFPPTYVYHFSDLDNSNLAQLKSIWSKINLERRINLLNDIKELSEADTTTSFENLAEITLYDPEAEVRIAGLKILWDTEDYHHLPRLLDLLENDPNNQVRVCAAEVLGEFVYLGELDKIPKNYHHIVEDTLISTFFKSDEPLIKQKIIESLGYSSREEVTNLIYSAFRENEPGWVSSALFAMGRSADKKWEKPVIDSLDHPDIRIKIEAVRASGELELESARKPIIEILKESTFDDDVHPVAIWSLSQIGGKEVQEILEKMLDESTNEDEIEYLEEALENLNFTQGIQQFKMFNFENQPKSNWIREISLEDEVEENMDYQIDDDEDDRR